MFCGLSQMVRLVDKTPNLSKSVSSTVERTWGHDNTYSTSINIAVMRSTAQKIARGKNASHNELNEGGTFLKRTKVPSCSSCELRARPSDPGRRQSSAPEPPLWSHSTSRRVYFSHLLTERVEFLSVVHKKHLVYKTRIWHIKFI